MLPSPCPEGAGRGGPGNSAEKHGTLPFAHTDFIFAPLGEEFGFTGPCSSCSAIS
ncbi:MAG: FtsW/RodA/SpoVE family cell cycle protein [Akkermansia sp.]